MLWVKTFHVLAVVAWMSGLFYLPRIFVNYAQATRLGEPTARLADMARRLYRFSSIVAVVALALGLTLWLVYGIDGRWLQWKLVFVLLLVAYHVYCGVLLGRMGRGALKFGPGFLRALNEAPVLILTAILILVIVKPI